MHFYMFTRMYICLGVYNVGCPRIVRGDRGSENSRIAYLQPFLRRNGEGVNNSFQYGRSASNQVYIIHNTQKQMYKSS